MAAAGDAAGGNEAAAGDAALIGGDGADLSAGKKGFNLSTETVQGLPARSNMNVFSERSRIS